ncbi:hypothetical protein [Pseudoalteromonas rubra]|uniref:Uncharacterized protein n=1 Tax=Pseudoalteromonas rubra TaxID=43658 RepID=A0A5S3WPN6_9GAMM|nr:hypothetical protein [Pseudoalteromonas rubra]TMP30762.1 hypothetical protein CWB98_23115 [Pseudoalteromonas rubra]
MNNQPWVKIYDDEAWDDAIVGNREGLLALKQAIDDALETECVEVADRFKSDFGVVAFTEQNWEQTEPTEVEGIWGFIVPFIVFLWGVVLPLYAIYKLAFE